MSHCYRLHSKSDVIDKTRDLINENLSILKRIGYVSILGRGIRWVKEGNGKNCYKNILEVIRDGYGDCEDLAAALVAMMIYIGMEAREFVYCQRVSELNTMCHVSTQVLFDGKWVEIDISSYMGMRKQ